MFNMDNIDIIKAAAEKQGVDVNFALAIAEQESNGRQIYGHDWGGTFSTASAPVVIEFETFPKGSNIPVTAKNYQIFYDAVINGAKSNGVGIFQLTYAGPVVNGKRNGGYLSQAKSQGFDLATAEGNAEFGCKVLKGLLDRAPVSGDEAFQWAAVVYNQGNPTTPTPWREHKYGISVMTKLAEWRKVPVEEPVAEVTNDELVQKIAEVEKRLAAVENIAAFSIESIAKLAERYELAADAWYKVVKD